MADTMRKVKGNNKRVHETGRKARLRDVEFSTPPSQETLDEGAKRLADWLAGNSRVMYDDEVQDD